MRARVLPRAEPSHHQPAPHDAFYYDDEEAPGVIELRPEQRAAAELAMARRRRAQHAAKNLEKVEETEREEV